jgi:predicted transcriptional regulator
MLCCNLGLFLLIYILILISRKEKGKIVIKLAEEGKTTREIAKEVHISLKDIDKIVRKATGNSQEGEKIENRILSHMLEHLKCLKIRKPLPMLL